MLTTIEVYGHALVFTASIWIFSAEPTSNLKCTSFFGSDKVKFLQFLSAVFRMSFTNIYVNHIDIKLVFT